MRYFKDDKNNYTIADVDLTSCGMAEISQDDYEAYISEVNKEIAETPTTEQQLADIMDALIELADIVAGGEE